MSGQPPAGRPSQPYRLVLALGMMVVGATLGAVLATELSVMVAVTVTLVSWVLLIPRLGVPVLVGTLLLQGLIVAILAPVDPQLAVAAQLLDEIALLAAGVRVGWLLLRGRWDLLSGRWLVYVTLFVVAGILSSLMHWGGIGPLALGAALALKFPSFLLLIRSVPWERRDADRLLMFARITVPIFLITGAIGLFAPGFQRMLLAASELNVDFSRGGVQPFVVPFTHPAIYGWILAVGTLAYMVTFLESRTVGGMLGILGGGAGALLSLRRRPLLGIPLAVLSGLISMSGRQRVWAISVIVVVALSMGFFGRQYFEATIRDTAASYLDPDTRTTAARAVLAAGSVVLARQSFPLGVGFGRYGGYASEKYFSPVYEQLGLSRLYGFSEETPYYIKDTYWPHILGETGALGTIAMLLMLGSLWQWMRVIRSGATDSATRRVALFAAMVLTEGFVESLAGPVFEVSLQALVIALPVGMTLALSQATTLKGDLDRGPSEAKQAEH